MLELKHLSGILQIPGAHMVGKYAGQRFNILIEKFLIASMIIFHSEISPDSVMDRVKHQITGYRLNDNLIRA